MDSENDNFAKPLLSLLGLIVAFTTAISPLFTKTSLTKYFINPDLITPASLTSVLIGIAVAWLVMDHPYFEISVGRIKDRGEGYKRSWKRLGGPSIILVALLFAIISFLAFFLTRHFNSDLIAVLQALLYICFFDIFIFIFALLVSRTKSRFEYNQKRAKMGDVIYSTLERNKLIIPGISIYENRQLKHDELEEYGISDFSARKISLETVSQKREHMEIILGSDGTELLKVVKKSHIEDS